MDTTTTTSTSTKENETLLNSCMVLPSTPTSAANGSGDEDVDHDRRSAAPRGGDQQDVSSSNDDVNVDQQQRLATIYQSRRDAVDMIMQLTADGSGRDGEDGSGRDGDGSGRVEDGGSGGESSSGDHDDDDIPIKPSNYYNSSTTMQQRRRRSRRSYRSTTSRSNKKEMNDYYYDDCGDSTSATSLSTMEQTRLSFQLERDRILSQVVQHHHHVVSGAEVVSGQDDDDIDGGGGADGAPANVDMEELIVSLIERRFQGAIQQRQNKIQQSQHQQQPPPQQQLEQEKQEPKTSKYSDGKTENFEIDDDSGGDDDGYGKYRHSASSKTTMTTSHRQTRDSNTKEKDDDDDVVVADAADSKKPSRSKHQEEEGDEEGEGSGAFSTTTTTVTRTESTTSTPGAFSVIPATTSVGCGPPRTLARSRSHQQQRQQYQRQHQQHRPSYIEVLDDDVSELASLAGGPSISGLPTARPIDATTVASSNGSGSLADIASIERIIEDKLNAIMVELGGSGVGGLAGSPLQILQQLHHHQEAQVELHRATSTTSSYSVPVIQQAVVIAADDEEEAQKSSSEMMQQDSKKPRMKLDFSVVNRKLYGRQVQVKYLRDIFEATVNSQNKQVLITVEGLSGVGKSKFVTTAFDPIINNSIMQEEEELHKNGLFITAKFDMNHSIDVPLDGMMMAMNDLCEQIVGVTTAATATDDGGSASCPQNDAVNNKNVIGSTSDGDACYLDTNQSSTAKKYSSSIKKQLQDELQEEELAFLIAMFPKLRDLLGKQLSNQEQPGDDGDDDNGSIVSESVDVKANADRLKYCFRRFIEVVCSVAPLVIFCDDLQWADQCSLDLLLEVLTNKANPTLMVVASFRSNLVDQDHNVSKFIRDFETDGQPVHRVEIGELPLHDLNLFLNDVLLCDHTTDGGSTMTLTQILHQKTDGNIFFVIQLLLSLQDQGILKYNESISRWEWNNEEVQSKCPTAANVVDLVKKKVKRVDSARHVLPIAACLGSSFNSELFKLTVEGFEKTRNSRTLSSSSDFALDLFNQSESQWTNQFECCIQEGFIESVGGAGSYKFIHDSIQEAAFGILGNYQRSELQYNVGMTIFRDADQKLLDANIFVVAGLIDSGMTGKDYAAMDIYDDDMKTRLVELFTNAGKRAMLCSAFVSATKYFETADRLLLPEERWSSHRQHLTIDILVSAVEAEYCVASFEKMNAYIDRLLQHEAQVSSTVKARICHVQMDAFIAQAQPKEAVRVAVETLAHLGCKLPTSSVGIGVAVVSGLLQFATSKRMKDPATISALKVSTDPVDLAVMKTLDKLATATYLCNVDMWPVVIFKSVNWTFEQGITSHSSASFACLALMITNIMQDFATGAAYGQHAMSLSERTKSKDVGPRTKFIYNAYTRHWTKPLKLCVPDFADASQNALICGDTQTAMYTAHCYVFCLLFIGTDLSFVDEEAEKHVGQMEAYGQDSTSLFTKFAWQTVRNLRGIHVETSSCSTTALSGDIMDEQGDLEEFRGSGELMEAYPNGYKVFLACYFGEYEFGADLAIRWGDAINKLLPGHPVILQVRFTGAVCCFAAAARLKDKKDKRKRMKYLREGKRLYKIIKVWSEKSPTSYNPNAVHQEVLLCAERYALSNRKKDQNKVHKYYEFAEIMACKRDLIHDQALVNERWSDYYYRVQGDIEQAKIKLEESITLYRKWGAQRKVDMLQNTLEKLTLEN